MDWNGMDEEKDRSGRCERREESRCQSLSLSLSECDYSNFQLRVSYRSDLATLGSIY